MFRDDLNGLPRYTMPGGYTIRGYQPGDREAWLYIHELAECDRPVDEDIYEGQFDDTDDVRAIRQFFLLNAAGAEIGTASAWYGDDTQGRHWGRIHWVAIVPDEQGHGLAKPFMSFICDKLIEFGHNNAYLTTWDVKVPAINLYLLFGFKPQINGENDRVNWDRVLAKCKY